MSRLIIGLAFCSLLFLVSCEKEKETPGGIPGMGDTPGNLEVKEAFKLPDGISIAGDIIGVIEKTKNSEGAKSASAIKTEPNYGSGGKAVKLQVSFTNNSNYPRTVVFPKGLLWECSLPGYQHAILLQTTWVSIGANSNRTIIIDLYCINWGLEPSYENVTFRILGVTGSNIIWQFLDLIGWKKINYEMIYHFTYGSKSAVLTGPTYDEITEKLQTILWNLTDFEKPISESDKAFILTIPELLPEEIPPVNDQGQYPEYFEEYNTFEK